MLFREGIGLADALEAVVHSLIARLPEGRAAGKVAFVRATLEGVAIKRESVSAVARAHARTREHWARTYWPQAVALVASEMATRDGQHERKQMTLEPGRAEPRDRIQPGPHAS